MENRNFLRWVGSIPRMIFGYEEYEEATPGFGSVFEPQNLKPETVNFKKGRYNRKRRRGGAFVLLDLYSSKYLKRDSKNNFLLCELEEASLFKFKYIEFAMNWALLSQPKIKVDYRLVIKDSNNDLKTV